MTSTNLLEWANAIEKQAGIRDLNLKRIFTHLGSKKGVRPAVDSIYDAVTNAEEATKLQEGMRNAIKNYTQQASNLVTNARNSVYPDVRMRRNYAERAAADAELPPAIEQVRDYLHDVIRGLPDAYGTPYDELARKVNYKRYRPEFFEPLAEDIISQNPSAYANYISHNGVRRNSVTGKIYNYDNVGRAADKVREIRSRRDFNDRDIKHINQLHAQATVHPEQFMTGPARELYNAFNKNRQDALNYANQLSQLRRFYENEPTPEEWKWIERIRKALIGAGLLGAGYAAGRATTN